MLVNIAKAMARKRLQNLATENYLLGKSDRRPAMMVLTEMVS